MSQYPAVIELADLNGANGFKISGAAAGDALPNVQTSISYAGDLNGDGLPDLIVGAPNADPNGASSGAAYILFGQPGGFPADIDLSQLNGTNGVTIEGPAAYAYLARSVAGIGDVNHDGVDDVIISAEGVNGYSGTTFVLYGHAGAWSPTLDLGALGSAQGAEFTGRVISTAAAGDVNGDGLPDFIIGNDQANNAAGAAYVVFGHAGGYAASSALSDLNGSTGFTISGAVADDFTGLSVSSAGDFNGDGYADVIVGAPDHDSGGVSSNGAAYLIYGHAGGFAANLDLSSLNGANGFALTGVGQGAGAGYSVASADINSDGLSDLLVGAIGANNVGSVYVMFGKAGAEPASMSLASLNGSNGFRIDGVEASGQAGFSVASAGDVNGDGFNDIIIGEPGPNASSAPGAAYVVFGAASGFPSVINLADLDGTKGFKIDGAAPGDDAGWTVAPSGDLNGDGLADMFVEANHADSNGTDSGASYVIYGQLPTSSVNRTGTDQGQNLVGGDSADVLNGMGGDDHLYGHGGADTLMGGAGNDVLDGGAGDDNLNGGTGTDTASYADATSGVTVSLQNTHAQNTVGAGIDTLSQIENLTGSAFADTLTAASAGSVLRGLDGADILVSGAGNDTLDGGAGADTASYAGAKAGVTVNLALSGQQNTGGAGKDTLVAIENLIGSKFADTLTAGPGGSHIDGGAGNDILVSGAGDDSFEGGAGVDTAIFSGAYADYVVDRHNTPTTATVTGPDGLDFLSNVEILKFADEQLVNSDDGQTLTARPRGDILVGNMSADHLNGGAGNDVINGGGGYNTAIFNGNLAEFSIKQNGGTTTVKDLTPNRDGTDSLQKVQVLQFQDAQVLNISTGGELVARAAGDQLVGGAGQDHLVGGDGNDILKGGAGQDTLEGHGGADHFVFTALADSKTSAPDLITDWTSGDLIDLSAIDANTKTSGDQAFHLGATSAHTGDSVIHYDAAHDRTVIDLYVDKDAKADAEIWLSGDHHGLTAADFVL